MLRKLISALLLLAAANSVYGDCIYGGVSYPEGAVIGPYVCSGGQWVRR